MLKSSPSSLVAQSWSRTKGGILGTTAPSLYSYALSGSSSDVNLLLNSWTLPQRNEVILNLTCHSTLYVDIGVHSEPVSFHRSVSNAWCPSHYNIIAS